jgi:hypothetical protein
MTDKILTTPFGFYLLDSNFFDWRYRDVAKGDNLIVLGEMELIVPLGMVGVIVGEALVRAGGAAGYAAVRVYDTVSLQNEVEEHIWKIFNENCKNSRQEFDQTGKIDGYELLNLRTLDRLWISHFDMKMLRTLK